ncbi:MAG TPA: KTSC domain-containing protein [Salinimicrobium sp.]|nr:KTSC domain-containing protein [Salinimicrobium sp.]
MKRINEYKKLFQVEKNIELKQLKTTYRNLVKEWHPDKFMDGDAGREEAEVMSRKIIDGYHFLVSIAPETLAANEEDYNKTISEAGIADFHHKGNVLEISFTDGTTYEYFGVNKALFIKFINSDKRVRFAKRNFFHSLVYRKSKKDLELQEA